MADVKFLSWDSEITKDAPEFILLPEGDYPFMVQGLEKSIYEGNSEKIGHGCPMAVLKIVVKGPQGYTSITDRLYLSENMEWKLGQFFRCIGERCGNALGYAGGGTLHDIKDGSGLETFN